MNKYQDLYTAYHDSPKGSNNPFIYTALADILELPIDYFSIHELFKECSDTTFGYWRLGRYPSRRDKLSSRDEILGAYHLGKLPYSQLARHSFRYEYQWIKFRPWRTCTALYSLVGKHRNYAHENNITDVYPVMFWLPWWDQHYIRKTSGIKTSPIMYILFFLYTVSVLIKPNYKKGEKQTGNISAKNILYLQLFDMNSKWLIRFVDHKKNLSDYFEVDHPISEAVNV